MPIEEHPAAAGHDLAPDDSFAADLAFADDTERRAAVVVET
jgi:hypothetical protein